MRDIRALTQRLLFGRMSLLLAGLTLCVLLSPAIGQATETKLLLATIGGHPITDSEVVVEAEQRNLLRPKPFTDTAMIRELVEDVIIDSLVSREAPKYDFSKEYAFWAEVRGSMTSAAALYYQQDVLAPKLTIDSSQIEEYYRSHLARYMTPHEQRFVRNITIYYPMEKVPKIYNQQRDSLYDGWNPQAVIEALYARLADGEDFAALATAHSEEPRTKGYGGDIGWVSKESLPDDEFGRMCLQSPLYRISKPFTSRVGWHIVQVTGIRPAGPAPIDSAIKADIITNVRDSIGKILAKQIMDSLAAIGKLEIFDKTLELPDSVWKPNTPLAIANDRDTILAAEYLTLTARLRAKPRLIPKTLEDKRRIVQSVLPSLCMYNAMRNLGYLNLSGVQQQRETLIRTRAESALLAQMTDQTFSPDSASISRYYREHAADFARPDAYMVRYLRFPDQRSADSVATAWKAGKMPDSLESRWIQQNDSPKPVWTAVTHMTEGDVTAPIAADNEYWVTMLAEKSVPSTLADAAPRIRSELQSAHDRKLRANWVQKIGARYGITRHPELYARVVLPSSKGRKLPVKPGPDLSKLKGY